MIIVRGDDGEIRAFHNVCRHRGSRLCTTPSGSAGSSSAPTTSGPTTSTAACCPPPAGGVRPRRRPQAGALRDVGGLVFICLADEPPTDFVEGPARRPYLAPHELRTRRSPTRRHRRGGQLEAGLENNRECYHCAATPSCSSAYFPLHGYTAEDVPPRLRRVWERFEKATSGPAGRVRPASCFPVDWIRELDNRPTAFLDRTRPRSTAPGKSYTRGRRGRVPQAAGRHRRATGSVTCHLHMQPNSWFHMLSDHAVVFTVLPLGPDKTFLRFDLVGARRRRRGGRLRRGRPSPTVWNATNVQDSTFVARAQRGVQDAGDEPGPYSEIEGDVEAFVTWYISRVNAHLSSEGRRAPLYSVDTPSVSCLAMGHRRRRGSSSTSR